jgi:hypothetical protein
MFFVWQSKKEEEMPHEMPGNFKKKYDQDNKIYEELESKILLTNQVIRQATKVINQMEFTVDTLATLMINNQANTDISNNRSDERDNLKNLLIVLKKNVVNLREVVGALEI